jgi:hypothetical protein
MADTPAKKPLNKAPLLLITAGLALVFGLGFLLNPWKSRLGKTKEIAIKNDAKEQPLFEEEKQKSDLIQEELDWTFEASKISGLEALKLAVARSEYSAVRKILETKPEIHWGKINYLFYIHDFLGGLSFSK